MTVRSGFGQIELSGLDDHRMTDQDVPTDKGRSVVGEMFRNISRIFSVIVEGLRIHSSNRASA